MGCGEVADDESACGVRHAGRLAYLGCATVVRPAECARSPCLPRLGQKRRHRPAITSDFLQRGPRPGASIVPTAHGRCKIVEVGMSWILAAADGGKRSCPDFACPLFA